MRFNVGIYGMGKAIPKRILTNAELETMVDTSDEWITTRTGIKQRYIADADTTATDLGYQAALIALRETNLSAEDLDLIIVATSTPDQSMPATACLIQARLGAERAAAFDVAAACSGFVYGLEIGKNMVAGGYNHVLVIGVDILSRMVDYSDRATCILFGDGAGAAVLGKVKEGYGFIASELGADGRGAKYLQFAKDDLGSQHITMVGREVFKFAVTTMSESTKRVLDKAEIASEQIRWFIPHQANIRIIHAAADRLDIEKDRVFVNVDRYGNTSAASIPIAMTELIDSKQIDEDDLIILVGFGAGLTWGSTLLRWGGELP